MTTSHLQPTAVLSKEPAKDTPEHPPSPPPSRQGTCSSLGPEDPFRDPQGSHERHGCSPDQQPSYTDGVPFAPVFTDDSDEPRTTTCKAQSRAAPRWKELLRRGKLLLALENSGSVARDHLASERTFLAYVRTSLTLSSAGVGLVQLFSLSAETGNREDLERFARPLGATMIGVGLYTLLVGAIRYFIVQDALVRGVYPVARLSASMLAFAVVVLVVAVFIVILTRT
ncbi:hypothetical protein ONZ51_g818 [Trametes cubensis]|uniref:DUF202 domain-containing protein n=1 Tax=Trametes cubensis TaxID=1111947 RepID=A0AAD7U2R0_9APHY|nr:hypothetical protein ONZ51_g818 [Trametes cubensis]